jgi:hypothetical protein
MLLAATAKHAPVATGNEQGGGSTATFAGTASVGRGGGALVAAATTTASTGPAPPHSPRQQGTTVQLDGTTVQFDGTVRGHSRMNSKRSLGLQVPHGVLSAALAELEATALQLASAAAACLPPGVCHASCQVRICVFVSVAAR